MAASMSGLYALSGVASKIPIISTVQRSVRAISRSRKASSASSSSQELPFQSGASTPTFTESTTSRDLILSTSGPESQLDIPSDSEALQWGFKGGVDWETAKTGIGIWHDAVRRMDILDAGRVRQMQIDAIKYMHNSLPPNLSDRELAILEDSLGACQRSDRFVLTTDQPVSNLLVDKPVVGNNLVRTTIAQLVYWFISLVIFAIPVMMTLLNRGLKYEREHQISKRAVENGADLAKAASSIGLDLGEKVFRFKDTEIGIYCGAGLAWTFQSMLEGINDGIQSSRSQYFLESVKS